LIFSEAWVAFCPRRKQIHYRVTFFGKCCWICSFRMAFIDSWFSRVRILLHSFRFFCLQTLFITLWIRVTRFYFGGHRSFLHRCDLGGLCLLFHYASTKAPPARSSTGEFAFFVISSPVFSSLCFVQAFFFFRW